MSFVKQIREWLDHLRGKGPAAAVALSLDLGEARDNKPFMLEAGGLIVERCTGDLYVRVNAPNGDGFNLRYVRRILYPFSALYLTNTAQSGKTARVLLLSEGTDAAPGPIDDLARQHPSDRNISAAGGYYWADGVAPHYYTFRVQYTVPTGRKAEVTQAMARVQRITAPTTVGRAYCYVADNTTLFLMVQLYTSTVGASENAFLGKSSVVTEGTLLGIVTADSSVGGTCDYHAGLEIMEYDA